MQILVYFLLAIIIFSVISCSDEIDTTNERLRVQQILHKYAEAWRAKNMDLFGELFSDDIDMIILDHCPCSFFFSKSIIIRSKQKLTHTQRFQLTRLAVVSLYYCNLKGTFCVFSKVLILIGGGQLKRVVMWAYKIIIKGQHEL